MLSLKYGRIGFVKGKLPKFKSTGKKKWIIIAIVVLLIAALAFFMFGGKKKSASAESKFTEYTVGKSDISVVISGSGTIQANEQYDITSLSTGDVLASYFEEGDMVEEGAVLYEIDTENIKNSIEKAKNSVETAKMSYDDALEDVENLNVKANCSGTITNVYIKEGDSLNKGTKIADVVDDSTMILKIPFNQNDAQNLSVGESVTVRLESSAYEVPGKISRISTGSTVSSSGVSVKNVTIEIKNPGTIKAGEKAIAYTSKYACNEAGVFEVYDERAITAEMAGEVEWIKIGVGDKVSKGQQIAQLTSKTASNAVKRNELSYKDAQLSLDNLYENMADYTIKAPISGTVISKTTKAGDKLDNSTKSTVMAVIADMSRMLFEISVDELDIAKLEVGQKVSVTADALEGRFFEGYIDKISIIGSTSNGVTTYPVTVVIEEHEGLIPGMNVDAEITVQEVKDVVSVPVSAIMRGNLVAVKSTGKAPETNKEESSAENKEKDQKPEGMREGQKPEGMREGQMAEGMKEGKKPEGMREGKMPEGMKEGKMPEGKAEGKAEEKTEGKTNENKTKSDMSDMPQGDKAKQMQKAFGQELPEGFELRRVEVGLSNSDNVEIVSGLKEGDIILVRQVEATSLQNMMMGAMGGGRMPSGGGRMPMGGGMTSGGMNRQSGGNNRNMGGGNR